MAFFIKQETAQKMVEAIKDVCSHDINFINQKGIIFASTNTNRIGDFHEIGREVIRTGQTIEVTSDSNYHGTQKGVNIPLIYKGDISAVIGISGEPDEVRKYAYLAQKITSLILRENELDTSAHMKERQINQIIRSLISKEYLNPEYLNEFLRKHHISLEQSFRTILVKLDSKYHPSNLFTIESYINKAFAQTGSSLYTFVYPNEYILLLESDKLEQYHHLLENLGQEHAPVLKIGVGLSCKLKKIAQSYQTAKIAAKSLIGNESYILFNRLDLEILLGNIPADIKDYYIQRTTSSLTEREKEILSAYYSNHMSLKDTSEQLCLHKNTLQYQLDKISEKTGYNPRKFKDAVILYISLKCRT